MELTLQKLRELGLDTETGIGYTGSPEKYIAAIARYVRCCGDNTADIGKHLASGYPFEDGDKEKLAQAKKYIGDFMYDEAAELIKELQSGIK